MMDLFWNGITSGTPKQSTPSLAFQLGIFGLSQQYKMIFIVLFIITDRTFRKIIIMIVRPNILCTQSSVSCPTRKCPPSSSATTRCSRLSTRPTLSSLGTTTWGTKEGSRSPKIRLERWQRIFFTHRMTTVKKYSIHFSWQFGSFFKISQNCSKRTPWAQMVVIDGMRHS
jgi:hypothetical protein